MIFRLGRNTLGCWASITLVGWLTLPTYASQDTLQEGHPEPAKYTVGVEDVSFYPYYDFVERKENNGVLRDILDRFAQHKGIQFEYVALPTKRFSNWYEESKIDFRVPDNPVWHQENKADLIFSNHMLRLDSGTVVLKPNKDLAFEAFEVIGTLAGYTTNAHWQQAFASRDVAVMEDASIKVLIRLLYEGHLQGLDLDIYTVKYHARAMGLDASELVYAENVPVIPLEYYISTVLHQELIGEFNEYVEAHRQEIGEMLMQIRSTADDN